MISYLVHHCHAEVLPDGHAQQLDMPAAGESKVVRQPRDPARHPEPACTHPWSERAERSALNPSLCIGRHGVGRQDPATHLQPVRERILIVKPEVGGGRWAGLHMCLQCAIATRLCGKAGLLCICIRSHRSAFLPSAPTTGTSRKATSGTPSSLDRISKWPAGRGCPSMEMASPWLRATG